MILTRASLVTLIGMLVFCSSSLAKADTKAADPSLVWQFNRVIDKAAHVDRAELVYGIPETDAVGAVATCDAQSSGNVVLNLSANVTRPDKSKLKARIFGQWLNAVAIIPASGEGLSGFGVTLPPNGALIGQLQTKSSLIYGLKTGNEQKISLVIGKPAIGKFIRACQGFANPN
jgi:hypothetical protein